MKNVELDFPPWDLKEVALIVVYPADELSFLKANPSAIHPSLTPRGTWESGFNWNSEVLTNAHTSARSQAETDIPGALPAVLLLRELPKNGGAYIFGRVSGGLKPDVALPSSLASRRHFCVYPNLLHRTWVIQGLSGKDITIDDYTLSSKVEDQGQNTLLRSLEYDRLNRVVFAETAHYQGLTLYIKPVWPGDSKYLQWNWQDPDIPELAGLNLSWTLISPTLTQSQKPRPQESATPTTFCILKRQLCDNIDVFYGQELDTGAMFAAEKFSSKHEAKEQFSWRKDLKARVFLPFTLFKSTDWKQDEEHLLEVSYVCLLDHPYILTACPFDSHSLADVIGDEPLNDRTAYTLLRETLSTLDYLYKKGIAGITLSPTSIQVADLSPENPRFWLTGISSARPILRGKIKERHSADVDMAMRIIADARGGPDYFQDPVANIIFTGLLQALQSESLSAQEILAKFEILVGQDVSFPFKSENLTRAFSIKRFQLDDQVYYRKIELARIARALFAQTAKGSQQAYTRILSTKPSKIHEGEHLLHWGVAQKVFRRLDKDVTIGFWTRLEPATKTKRGREGGGEGKEKCIQDFDIQIRITYHAPSRMWNLSQLINAIGPIDFPEIEDANHYVEVGGDAACEGLYVDLPTFERACRLLRVSPPKSSENDPNPKAEQFRFVSSKGDLVLADEQLLGTAIFRRSSRTLYYGGTEYPEGRAVQLFPQGTFENLHHGISESRCPPQSLKILCQGQPAQDFPESQCLSLTESQSDDGLAFKRRCASPNPDRGPAKKKTLTEQWLTEQSTRRRYSGPDIWKSVTVGGHLQPVDDGLEDVTSCSPSRSTVTTAQTPRYVCNRKG